MKKTISLFFAAICLTSISSAQPNMIRVKGGTFEMGDTAGDADEKPLHQVLITDFMLAATETTYQEFEAFVRATGYVTDAERGEGSYIWDSLGWHIRLGVHWRHDALGRTIQSSNEYPVIHVSWNDATQYCNWLSEKQGLIKVYDFQFDSLVINLQANGYRLPTEAEWEYAAAGGATKKKAIFLAKVLWAPWLGMQQTPTTAYRKLPKKAPTHWVFPTLAAMFGNGATIGTTRIHINSTPIPILLAQARAKKEAFGAAPGTTMPGTAA